MKVAITLITFTASVFFGFTFLIQWASHRKELSTFKDLGIAFSVLYLVLQVLLVLLYFDPPLSFADFATAKLVILMLLDCFKLYVTLTLGCYYAYQLGYPVFPLIKNRKTGFRIWPNVTKLTSCVFLVIVVVALLTVFSYILFLITPFSISDGLFGSGSSTLLIAVVTAFGPAVFEEIIYRVGIQNYLTKVLGDSRYWVAVTLTTILWTMAHIDAMDIYWIKFVQVFPSGFLFAWLNKKYGTESAIIAHGLVNLLGDLMLLSLSQM
jgi:membrane protease YdiL (CAAX protease family)